MARHAGRIQEALAECWKWREMRAARGWRRAHRCLELPHPPDLRHLGNCCNILLGPIIQKYGRSSSTFVSLTFPRQSSPLGIITCPHYSCLVPLNNSYSIIPLSLLQTVLFNTKSWKSHFGRALDLNK